MHLRHVSRLLGGLACGALAGLVGAAVPAWGQGFSQPGMMRLVIGACFGLIAGPAFLAARPVGAARWSLAWLVFATPALAVSAIGLRSGADADLTWMNAGIPALWGGALLAAIAVPGPRPRAFRCTGCGYDRRAAPDDPCPECGRDAPVPTVQRSAAGVAPLWVWALASIPGLAVWWFGTRWLLSLG